MIKVYQNFLDNECFKACLCSIFHLKYDEVPNFYGPNMYEKITDFVGKNLDKEVVLTGPNVYIPDQYYIRTIGNTSIGAHHAYVALNDKLVHCPTGYPSRNHMFTEPITFKDLRYNTYKNSGLMVRQIQNYIFLDKGVFDEKPMQNL